MIRLLVLVVVVACSKSKPEPANRVPAPTPTQAASGAAFGWWQIPDDKAADDLAGGTMKLTADEMISVFKDGKLFIRPCKTSFTGTTGTITNCGPAAKLSLAGDRLTVEDRGTFIATRIPRDGAAKLDAHVAAKRPPADICDRAKTCYRDAMTSIGVKDIEEQMAREFANIGPTDCQRTIDGLVEIVKEKQKPVPASCK